MYVYIYMFVQYIGPLPPLTSSFLHHYQQLTLHSSFTHTLLSFLPPCRYELQFLVSDRVWKQERVSANVTVEVRHLSPETLSHSVPITLSPTTPTAIATNWTPNVSSYIMGKSLSFMVSCTILYTVLLLMCTSS